MGTSLATPGVGTRPPLVPGMRMPDPDGPADDERRIEDWIACHLDDRAPAAGPSGLGAWRRDGREPVGPRSASGWSRFRASKGSGVAVVRLLDANLVRESAIQDLADELADLIDAGARRIVLDFAGVERLSSPVIAALAEAQRRCASAPGGTIRVCGLRPEVADVLAVTGMARRIATYPDESSAMADPWPGPPCVEPLPVTILSALARAAASDATAGPPTFPMPDLDTNPEPTPPAPPDDDAPAIRLVVASGPAEGRSIPVRTTPFLVGRGPECRLRVNSPRVSRRHASVELRGGRAFLRDLGSTNGTLLNDRPLLGEESPLAVGDRVEVGPLRLEVAPGRVGDGPIRSEDLVVDWLRDEGPTAEFPVASPPPIDDETPEPGEPVPLDGEAAGDALRCALIAGVVVLTPRRSHLDDESAVGPLRAAFQSLHERPLPRRVVLNLTNVLHLSSRAIAAIVAHNLRLRHAGGTLRLCQVRPRLLSSLELVRLPMLVELHPTLDDAVLAEWP